MENQNIGIGSVPCQTWGELYTPQESLKIGTIFKDLNKPFFADKVNVDSTGTTVLDESTKSPEQQDRESLLTKIMEASFILDDLTLFLDTHPEDQNALTLFNKYNQIRKDLKKEFAKKHYPLTRDCISECNGDQNGFCWEMGPIPWEGACI